MYDLEVTGATQNTSSNLQFCGFTGSESAC